MVNIFAKPSTAGRYEVSPTNPNLPDSPFWTSNVYKPGATEPLYGNIFDWEVGHPMHYQHLVGLRNMMMQQLMGGKGETGLFNPNLPTYAKANQAAAGYGGLLDALNMGAQERLGKTEYAREGAGRLQSASQAAVGRALPQALFGQQLALDKDLLGKIMGLYTFGGNILASQVGNEAAQAQAKAARKSGKQSAFGGIPIIGGFFS